MVHLLYLGINLSVWANIKRFIHNLLWLISHLNLILISLLVDVGYKDLVTDEEFNNALYTIDIGQNDLAGSFTYLSYTQVIEKIPSMITEIKNAIWVSLNFSIFITRSHCFNSFKILYYISYSWWVWFLFNPNIDYIRTWRAKFLGT